jgi:hypothetical protein
MAGVRGIVFKLLFFAFRCRVHGLEEEQGFFNPFLVQIGF